MNVEEILLYALLVVVIVLTLVSFFLIWHWFDARERLHIVRKDTSRSQQMPSTAIHRIGIGSVLCVCSLCTW